MADRLTLGDLVGILHPLGGGGRFSPGEPIGAVTADSREVAPGGLFVALAGERVDGAEFAEEAFRKGAQAVIVSEEGAWKIPPAILAGHPVFVVRSPVEALGDLARAHRERLRHIPLVGITGSSGKTSTKEMLAALLSRNRSVLGNPGNRNNLIGLPLALLGLSAAHDVAVLEMGTNQPGEIARLSAIAAPDVGVVTNIAPAHLEGLRSLEGVAREKGDLYRSLPESGTAVVNATDLRVMREAGRCRAAKIHYGVALNEVSGRVLAMDEGGMRIAVRTPSGEFSSSLPFPGEHNLMNALAAVAAAYALGMRPEEMEEGFSSLPPLRGRFRPVPLRGGGLLLDDSYNANPASVEAALRNLVALRRGRRCVVVLADMLELGEASETAHFRTGHLVASMAPDLLFTWGSEAASIARGAGAGGMAPGRIVHAGDRDALLRALTGALREGDVVLIKGSRGMRLEEVVEAVEREWA
jgi:UDP-N-acetylmuramoyl-tripeptide--D-alanyl-D-alanine ligase